MCSRTVLNELKNLQSQKKIPFRLPRRLVQRFCKAYISFCLVSPCWMKPEVADNWFAVVDRFVAASSLRMIFFGQTGCRYIFLISVRLFATS